MQLAKRRGAIVTAIVSAAKVDQVSILGADRVVTRESDLLELLGEKSMDVVIDNVAGEAFSDMIRILKRGGRYASSGAIAGPIVNLDMRDFYLKDLTLIGCTGWDEPVFPNLISYIERKEIKPLLAKIFELKDIVQAQTEFLEKAHIGKFVLTPPSLTQAQKQFIEKIGG